MTSATTWRYTPKASTQIPTSTESTCRGYSAGAKSANIHMEKSIRYPNAKEMTTSRPRLTHPSRSSLPLSRMPCRATSSRLNRMVKFPRVIDGNTIDRLYGIEVIGEVPSEAFVMRPMPSEITNRASARRQYLRAR